MYEGILKLKSLDKALDINFVLHGADLLDVVLDFIERESPGYLGFVDAKIRGTKGGCDALAKKVCLGKNGVVGVLDEQGELSCVDRLHLFDLANGSIDLLGITERERSKNIILRLRHTCENLRDICENLHESLIVLLEGADPAAHLIDFFLCCSHFSNSFNETRSKS